MSALHRLLQLHLITQQDQILCRTRHCNGVGQTDLSRFINEEKIELITPLGSTEQPRGSTNNAASVQSTRFRSVLNVNQPRVRLEQFIIRIIPDFNSAEFSALATRDYTTLA